VPWEIVQIVLTLDLMRAAVEGHQALCGAHVEVEKVGRIQVGRDVGDKGYRFLLFTVLNKSERFTISSSSSAYSAASSPSRVHRHEVGCSGSVGGRVIGLSGRCHCQYPITRSRCVAIVEWFRTGRRKVYCGLSGLFADSQRTRLSTSALVWQVVGSLGFPTARDPTQTRG
jgi:hypothetical protein